jgi:hypothetical protein
MMRRLLLPLIALAAAACAAPAATTPAPVTPAAPAAPAPRDAAADAAAFAIDGPVREEWMPLLKPPIIDPAKTKLLSAPAGLAPVPAACGAFAGRKGDGKAKCGDPVSALAALDAALSIDTGVTPEARDAALAGLEGCAGLPAGVARALRAEMAPIECGEAIVKPLLDAPPGSMNGTVYHALLGEAIASRLARAAKSPPELAPPHDRPRVLEFTRGPMRAWFEEQARAIEDVAQAAAELPYYAKGIAAIEAGIADLRLVEAARSAPIPDEFKNDEELRNTYYGSLDQWLDPRKDRGRDAALVGLKELSLAGVIHDARVDRARAMLSRLYGGRRVDALDALLLPALPRFAPASVEERLAARLPTVYAGLLLDEQAASRPGTLRALMEKGLPLPQRMALRSAQLGPDAQALYARARIELGQLYWSAADFDQAAALATASRAAAPSDDATFSLALALALRGGPDDASDMMRKAPRALPEPRTGALDVLAAQGPGGRYAGLAAFDAALLHQLAAPEGAGAPYWNDVAKRFEAAAALLADPTQRAAADERAKAAAAVARAVVEGAAAPGKPAGGK